MTPHRAWLRRGCIAGLLHLSLAACQTATPPASHADIVRADLALILGAQSSVCTAVRRFTREDRLDYRVECESGPVYRVRVGADGRVQVKALTDSDSPLH